MPPSAQVPAKPAHVTQPSPVQAAVPVKPPQAEIPNLPPLPPENAPPTAIIGVLSVPEVMQQSTAAQAVQAEIQKRQAVLKKEEDTAQAGLQAQQQQILAERGKMPQAEFEKKVQDWQNQVAAAQTKFQEENQSIQNAGQAALSKIEAELIGIIRQEAQAHGMNLILHREQVVLNVAAFDLTDETVKELNKLLPHVTVPPDFNTPDDTSQPEQGVGQ